MVLQAILILIDRKHKETVFFSQTQVSSPTEVCCCPDFTLSLSAKESSSTKSLQNGFLYVTEQGSDVSLQ